MQKDSVRSLGKQPKAIKQESGLLKTAAISRQPCEVSAGWGQGGGLFPQRICLTQTSFPCSIKTGCVYPPTYDKMGVAGLSATGFLLPSRVHRKDCESSRFLYASSALSTIPRHTRSLLTNCI